MSGRDVVVVGGGPAGMRAALAAAEHGVNVTLVDEGVDLGGQIHRAPTRVVRRSERRARGDALRAAVQRHGDRIDLRRRAVAWGVFDGPSVAITTETGTERLAARQVVLCPGAMEWVVPFPGWTLPGVMTPGAGQILVETMGIEPGKRVLIAGTGPFLLAAACALVVAGVDVAGVLEASKRSQWLRLPFRARRTPRVLWEGLGYLTSLARHGVPVRYGRAVVRATGTDRVHAVYHAPVDDDWRPDAGRVETEDVDTLLIGYGFVSRSDLAQSAGCRLALRDGSGDWVPVRDDDLQTSVPGVLAAGDGSGVAGVIVAETEGRLAGLVAASRVGAIDSTRLRALRRSLDRRLRHLARLRDALDTISRVRPGLLDLIEDDTLVCRCEEIPRSEVAAAVRHGCTTHPSLRVATRVAMGACQGRVCWPSVSRMVARQRDVPLSDVGPRSTRPPVRPITLGELASGAGGT